MRTKQWAMKSGEKIRVCDMTDLHLINTINMLCRAHARHQHELPYPMFNGEMAQFYAEREWDNFMESGPEDEWEIFSTLAEEAFDRKLKWKER